MDSILLYEIPEITVYDVQNGQERLVTSQGPQILSLIMKPNSSAPSSATSEESRQLHLVINPILDHVVPAATIVLSILPRSYLIPHSNEKLSISTVTRIEFQPESNRKGVHDEIDTFESILAQCEVMVRRVSPPPPLPYVPSTYDPSTYKPTSDSSLGSQGGQLVVIDENNGNVIGELGSGFQVVENAKFNSGTNGPVQITLPTDDSGKIDVSTSSVSYLDLASHPVYKDSSLISKATMASKFIVTTSSYVTKTLQSQADSFTQKSKPNPKPLKFEPSTHARISKVCNFTESAAGISAKTVGQVQKYAQNIGASVVRSDKIKTKAGITPDGKQLKTHKPGMINKGIVAFSTIADGIDHASRNMLSGTSSAVTTVVGHKYGREAGDITQKLGAGVRNVGLVYIDAMGIQRQAIIKSVVKGMVIGKLHDGSKLVVGGGEGKDLYQNPNVKGDQPYATNEIYKYHIHEQDSKEEPVAPNVSNMSNSVEQPPPAYSACLGGSN